MIGYLKGLVIDVEVSSLIVLVGNIGYKVRVANGQWPIANGQEVELFIHTHVREDELALFGFADKKSLKMFELLIGVSGVGPKMAMNILGHGSAEAIHKAVSTADVGFFTKVSGIGKKNAQRIIVDLKGKLGGLSELDLSEDVEIADDLAEGLVAMGFDKGKVAKVLGGLDQSLPESERLKLALKKLSG